MKSKLLVAGLALLTTQTVLADTTKQVHCLSVNALKSVGVSTVTYGTGWVGVRWNHHFNTKNTWTLFVSPINVKGEEQVVKEANSQLSKMSYSDTMLYNGRTVCNYQTPDGVTAKAISPALAPSSHTFT